MSKNSFIARGRKMIQTYNIMNSVSLLNSTSTIDITSISGIPPTIQAYISGTGGATIELSVSIDGNVWSTLGTITLSTTDGDSGEIAVNQIWTKVRAKLTSIGSTSSVTVLAAF